MPLDLKPPIATYFASSNAHDADGLAALFTEDGRVEDEQSDHRGQGAIRGWAEDTFRKYATVLSPRQAAVESEATVVTTGVAGTFPGSPIELDFRFVVEGERIKKLQIS